MAKQTSKDQLLRDIHTERTRLENCLSELTREEMEQAGVTEAWSVKDILAHLAAWECLLLDWIQAGVRGCAPTVAPVGRSRKIIDRLNQDIYEKNRDCPLDEVISGLRKSYEQVLTAVEAMSEEDLFGHGRFEWTGQLLLADYVAGNTCSHYAWARAQIRKRASQDANPTLPSPGVRVRRRVTGQAMHPYVIQSYRSGFDPDQVRIGIEVARNWIWPYAYQLEGLLKIHSQPDFDPETSHYCFTGGRMVGYLSTRVSASSGSDPITAQLDFPRVLPGHEAAAGLLMERAFETLRKKGVARIEGRVTSMCPGDVRLAEQTGFWMRDWGYKVYYNYEMNWGALDLPGQQALEMDPAKDLDECAALAARWYRQPPEWCRTLLSDWHAAGLIAHLGVRRGGRLAAACLAAPNDLRPSTAAIYYIFSPDEDSLKALLAGVVNRCIACGATNLIADLINEHHQYEPVYQALGFKKAAEWARCEKELISQARPDLG
jgi:hypothetical protein